MILRPHHARAAFTLVELVISSALMAIILVAAYLCLSAGISSEKLINTRSEAAQSARVALDLISADLRNAVPLWREFEFVGMRRQLGDSRADNLDFATRNYIPANPGEMDFCEVSYFLEQDPRSSSLVLFRRRDPTPDPEPLAGGRKEEIARGVRFLRLEYYDGWDWWSEWGDPEGKQRFSAHPDPNISGLPEAVRITLALDPDFTARNSTEPDPETEPAPPLVFQTVARINLATYFFQRGNRNNSSSETTGNSPNPGGPP